MRYTTRNIRFSVTTTQLSSLIKQLEQERGELISLIPIALAPADTEQTSIPAPSYANELPKGSYIIRDFLAIFKEE